MLMLNSFQVLAFKMCHPCSTLLEDSEQTVVVFGHLGELDHVLCFRCGGGLKGWRPDEDPWEEHARHYPG